MTSSLFNHSLPCSYWYWGLSLHRAAQQLSYLGLYMILLCQYTFYILRTICDVLVLLYFCLLLLTCKFGIYFIFFFRFVCTILIRCLEIQAQWLIYGSKLTIRQHFIPLNIQLLSLHYVAMFLHECKGSIMPQVLIT